MKTVKLLIANVLVISTVWAAPLTNMVKIDTRLYSGSIVADANVVVFDVAYSNAVDGDDAIKFSNSGENFAIQRASSILVVEGRQPAVVNDSVPFKMWNMHQQAYRLELVTSNLFTPGLVAVLEDAYLNTSTVLNPNGTTNVNFTVSSGAGSGAGNRFRIIFRAAVPGPLPVTFISISANRKNAGVDIAWKVAAERNVKNYQLQRSADGIHFSVVATVMALGNSSLDHNYFASDETAPSTVIFYRINSVDKDGQNKYSSIVKVKAGDSRQGFSILSNPIRDGIINVQFSNQLAGRYSLKLMNSQGQGIVTAIVNHPGGNSNQLVNLPGSVTNGTYWLLVTTPANTISVQTLEINNR